MKISMSKVTMGILFAFTGLASANLLTNGDFETQGSGGTDDAAGWFRTNTAIMDRWEENGQAGHGDWMMLRQDNDPNYHWASQKVAVTPGQEYQAYAEFKAVMQAGEIAFIYMEWHDSGGGYISNVYNTYTSGDGDYADWAWVSRSVSQVAPANAAEVEVRFESLSDGNGDSAIFADNMSLDAIPEPATLGLFGLVGGAMLWMRNKKRRI